MQVGKLPHPAPLCSHLQKKKKKHVYIYIPSFTEKNKNKKRRKLSEESKAKWMILKSSILIGMVDSSRPRVCDPNTDKDGINVWIHDVFPIYQCHKNSFHFRAYLGMFKEEVLEIFYLKLR